MPIYAFECTRCGHRFERLQRLSDPDPTACPVCAAEGDVRRQLTAPSFRLAGGGWYETDFKKDGDKKRNLADKGDAPVKTEGASAGEAKPSATSADARPAAAPSEGKSAKSGAAAPQATAPAPKPAPPSKDT